MNRPLCFLANFLLLGALLGLCGCTTTTYVPSPGAVNAKLVPDFPAGTKIALINNQPADERVQISQPPFAYTVYGSLHVWTEKAIESFTDTLKRKGVAVLATANRSLKVKVTKVELLQAGSGWAARCIVHWTVETSDGRVLTANAEQASWKFVMACDDVFSKVGQITLTDDKIVKFISGQ